MQTDGNLVLYRGSNPALWASGTAGRPGTVAQMQTDGNLVLYAPGHVPIWASSTAGHPGAYLELQNDGNAVIYRDPGHVAVWASRTSGGGTSATPITPLYSDSRNVPCASGTRDLGVADGYHNSARVFIRLCAVAGLRSTSEESGNTAYRVPGANGEAVVNSRVSGAVAAMLRSAKASGLTLTASSAFRTMAHQQARATPIPSVGRATTAVWPARDFEPSDGIGHRLCRHRQFGRLHQRVGADVDVVAHQRSQVRVPSVQERALALGCAVRQHPLLTAESRLAMLSSQEIHRQPRRPLVERGAACWSSRTWSGGAGLRAAVAGAPFCAGAGFGCRLGIRHYGVSEKDRRPLRLLHPDLSVCSCPCVLNASSHGHLREVFPVVCLRPAIRAHAKSPFSRADRSRMRAADSGSRTRGNRARWAERRGGPDQLADVFRVIAAASVMARCLRSPNSCIVTAARTSSPPTVRPSPRRVRQGEEGVLEQRGRGWLARHHQTDRPEPLDPALADDLGRVPGQGRQEHARDPVQVADHRRDRPHPPVPQEPSHPGLEPVGASHATRCTRPAALTKRHERTIGVAHLAHQAVEGRAVQVPRRSHLHLDVPVDRRDEVLGSQPRRGMLAAALLAPSMISVSTVRVTDAAAHAAGRETCTRSRP